MSIKQILASAINPEASTNVPLVLGMEDLESVANMSNHKHDYDNYQSAIETIEDSVVSMENLSTVLASRDAEAEGGLDAMTAQLITASMEAIMLPLGGNTQEMPSQEAFVEDASGTIAVAQESIVETLKKAWIAIIEMIGNAVNAVVKWFKENLSNMGRLAKSAIALAEKAEKVKGKPKEAKLPVAKPWLVLSGVKANGLNPERIKDLVKTIIAKPKSVDEAMVIIEKLDEAIKAKDLAAGEGIINDIMYNIEKRGDKIIKEGKELPNGNIADNLEGVAGIGHYEYVLAGKSSPRLLYKVPGKEGYKGDTEAPAYDAKDTAKLAIAIAKAASDMSSIGKEIKDIEKLNKQISGAASRLGRVAFFQSKQLSKQTRLLQSEMKTLMSNAYAPLMAKMRTGNGILFAAYDFAKKSYANLEEAK